MQRLFTFLVRKCRLQIVETEFSLPPALEALEGQKSSKYIHYVNIDNFHPKESVCKLTNDHKDCWLTDCVPITRRSQKHPSAQGHHLHQSGSPTDPLPHKLSKLGNLSKSAQDDQAVVRWPFNRYQTHAAWVKCIISPRTHPEPVIDLSGAPTYQLVWMKQ